MSRSSLPLASLAIILLGAAAPIHAQLDDDALLKLALENSERVQLAELTREKSELDVELARARRGPQISGSLDLSYLTNPVDPIIIRTGELGTYDIGGAATQLPPEDVRVYEGMEATLFRIAGVVEQPVFTWGKLELGVELARDALALQVTSTLQTELEVELELRTAAAAARHLNTMAALSAEQAELAGELATLVRAAFDSGVVVRTDVLEARVGEQRAELATVEIRNQLESQLVVLRRLTGRTELRATDLSEPRFGSRPRLTDAGADEGSARPASPVLPNMAVRPAEELIERAVAVNPGLSALRQAGVVASRRRELAEAEARRRPDFGMRLEFAFSGPRIPPEPDWYGQDEGNLTVSIGLQSTIYDGGSGAAEAGQSRLDEASAAAELSDARGALAGRIREAVLAAELATARVSYLVSNAELLTEKLEVRRREFDAGVGNRDALVRAEMALLANELEMVSELLALEANVVMLETLTADSVLRQAAN